MSKGMFCDRNLLGMSTKEMEKKIKENSESQFTKLRIQRKDLQSESFQNVNGKSGKKNQGKFRITKLKSQRKNQKEWLLSVQNLF